MNKTANVILRIGVAFAFLYPAIDSFLDPFAWIDYFPQFLTNAVGQVGISSVLLLQIFAVVEIVIALWILSGWKIFIPSLAATALLVGIVAFNLQEFQLLFRDLAIAAASVAL